MLVEGNVAWALRAQLVSRQDTAWWGVCVCVGVTGAWRKRVQVAEFIIPSVSSLHLIQRKTNSKERNLPGCPGVSRWN